METGLQSLDVGQTHFNNPPELLAADKTRFFTPTTSHLYTTD
jgi:hypothetical protein